MSTDARRNVIERILVRHRDELLEFVARRGSGLLRFESHEDLFQGAAARALASAESFEHRGDEESLHWLKQIARRYIADRNDYWSRLRRDSARVMRLADGSSHTGTVLPEPAAARTGPFTFAARRELLVLAAKALAVLPERDQQLIQWTSEGVPLREQANRLGLSYDAVQRAGHRATQRFRSAFDVLGQ